MLCIYHSKVSPIGAILPYLTVLKSQLAAGGFPAAVDSESRGTGSRCSTPIYVKTPAGRQTYYGSDRASILLALILPLCLSLALSLRLSRSSSECACLRVLLWLATKKRAKKRRGSPLWYELAFPPSSTLEAGDHGVESTIRSQRKRYKPPLAHPRSARPLCRRLSTRFILPSPRDTLPTLQRRPSVRPSSLSAWRVGFLFALPCHASSVVASNSMVFPSHCPLSMADAASHTLSHSTYVCNPGVSLQRDKPANNSLLP